MRVPGYVKDRDVRASPARARTFGSGAVEPVEVHDLVPRRDEVVHELLLGVITRIDLRDRAQLGVRPEDEVGAAAGPLDPARVGVAALERVPSAGHRLPRRAHVEQVDEEVVGQTPGSRSEDAERRLLVVRAQDAEATDEDRHLRRAQVQQVRLVEQQVLGGQPVALPEVVAEPVGEKLERGERLHVGLLLRHVRAARPEGHLDVEAGVLGGLLDAPALPASTIRSATAHGGLGPLGAPVDLRARRGSSSPAHFATGVAVRMLTSGTTGPPKRIDLRYEMLDLVMRGAKHYETGTGTDLRLRSGVVIVNAPLVHVSGVFRVVQAVLDGRRIALLERFTVDGWTAAVREHRPKTVSLVPTALRMVLDDDVDDDVFTSIRSVVSGTAPLDPDLAEAFTARYGVPVLTSYGATEFGGGVAGWNLADHEEFAAAKRGSVGRAHEGCSLRVVDPDDGRDLGTDTVGLLEVRAAQLGTADWVRTTDLGRLDADGFLWIVGRADQTILRGGYKVQPEVVRRALERATASPKPPWSACPTNVSVRSRSPRSSSGRALGSTRGRACSGRRRAPARYEMPVSVTVVDELPRTTSGKADLAAVRTLVAARAARERRQGTGCSASRRCPPLLSWRRALRDLTDTVQSLEQSSPELEALVQTVRDAQQRLAPRRRTISALASVTIRRPTGACTSTTATASATTTRASREYTLELDLPRRRRRR